MSLNEQRCGLLPALQKSLLDLAVNSIRLGLRSGEPLRVPLASLAPELAEPRASFVTLEKRGELRGCIGSLEALRPLAFDIAVNAFAAAFRDPRFPPVMADELDRLDIHLSLLTPAEPIVASSDTDLIRQLEPGVDGLILQDGAQRGTFLPSVWDALPDPREFLMRLKRKAGLPVDHWSDTLEIYRYRTEMIP